MPEMSVRENKMGTMPIRKLLLNMSLPMMASMIVQALYNIVDSIFVAQISEDALTAVSLAFPVQTLMIALSAGTGVGINALLSKSLGQKNTKKVHLSAVNGIFIELLAMLLVMAFGTFLTPAFYLTQTSDPEIFSYGCDYMYVVTQLSLGLFMQVTFERLLQATGKTGLSMITQMIGAIFNIIMDPILIFGLCGFPEMGVLGAALATIGGQHLGGVIALVLNLKKNKEVPLFLKGFRPNGRIIGQILSVGFPSTLMQAIGAVMVYGMDLILMGFTSTATAVFGVYFKLNSLIFMPVFGLNNAMVPIIAYNYGAQHRRRITDTIRLGIFVALTIMVAGFLIFELLPGPLLSLFNASDNMLSLGVPALRIIAISFPVAAFCIAAGSVFQALGKGVYSLAVSFLRQIVVLLPCAYLLSLTGDVGYVWWSYIIAEGASLLISSLFLRRIHRLIISRIPE